VDIVESFIDVEIGEEEVSDIGFNKEVDDAPTANQLPMASPMRLETMTNWCLKLVLLQCLIQMMRQHHHQCPCPVQLYLCCLFACCPHWLIVAQSVFLKFIHCLSVIATCHTVTAGTSLHSDSCCCCCLLPVDFFFLNDFYFLLMPSLAARQNCDTTTTALALQTIPVLLACLLSPMVDYCPKYFI